jgi:hypothetical protein
VTALLEGACLTRPEIDQLLHYAQDGYNRAQQRLSSCPLLPAAVQDAAGVCADALRLLNDALDESVRAMLAEMDTM